MGKNNKKKHVQLTREQKATLNFQEGLQQVMWHPLFTPMDYRVWTRQEKNAPADMWAHVSNKGNIFYNLQLDATAAEWTYVLAHCMLHLGMEHFQEKADPLAWNVACDLVVARFLNDLKIGKPPNQRWMPTIGKGQSEEELYLRFVKNGVPPELADFGTSGVGYVDMLWETVPPYGRAGRNPDWAGLFGTGLKQAVKVAVDVAAGELESIYELRRYGSSSVSQRAKSWFINSYPLLGSLAASFTIIEDTRICQRMQVAVAAVDAQQREIYMNPAAGLDQDEARFVMAHELLHVGLRHHGRREGRDPYYWNVACDYVINNWLVEMNIGTRPAIGILYDPEYKNESAESMYDLIVNNLRQFRRLRTLRGKELGDMIEPAESAWWSTRDGMELDEFYRRCLAQGLTYHEHGGRGFLPAGLVEEIRALSVPPIPWDVELAQWFEEFFPPLEKHRTYARPSRRQMSTPDIPRPRYVYMHEPDNTRTFGVVLDTSGSMDRNLLAKALGAIASYSTARDVPAARVIFCDAHPYDAGFMSPDDIAGRVQIKGRGGTVLQPAVDLLQKAEDFPKKGPILIITDGWIEDNLRIRREHAFLIPDGHRLPFRAQGPIFRIS